MPGATLRDDVVSGERSTRAPGTHCKQRIEKGGNPVEEILKLDESCISNPRLEISNWTHRFVGTVQLKISNLGFEMQDSSNFKISSTGLAPIFRKTVRNNRS